LPIIFGVAHEFTIGMLDYVCGSLLELSR